MTARRLTRLVALLPALVLALAPGTAHAADEIGVSLDGTTWVPDLTTPLFDPAMRWVPGDDETRTFLVRHQGPSSATMSIEAVTAGGEQVFENDIDLSVRVDGGDWIPLEPSVETRDLTVRPVAAGEVVQVDVRAVFDPASTNETQARTLPLEFHIVLAEAFPAPPGGPGTGPDGGLPTTGSRIGVDLLLAGLLACAVGGALIAARRRDGEEQHG